MQFIFRIIAKNGLFLLYLLLATIAFVFTFRQRVYHKSVFDKASTEVGGYVDHKISGVTQFLDLRKGNRDLLEENTELRKELQRLKGEAAEREMDSIPVSNLQFHQIYSFIPVEIINNSVMNSHNMMTLNKGSRQGIEKGMGVISSNGVLGYVYKTTENYSRVLSTLNTNTKITAQIKRSKYFGTITWDGKDPRYVKLQEIPKYIEVEKGDTIETDGKSSVIPGGVMIGTVSEKSVNESTGELNILVELKEDFARVRYGEVVVSLAKQEIEKVEESDSLLIDRNVQR